MNEHTETTESPVTTPTRAFISQHDFVAHLAALGMNTHVISEQSGVPEELVKSLMADEKMQFEVKRLKHQYFKNSPKKRFELLAHRAIDVKEEMLGETKKDSVRNRAAEDILDRHLGKPEQTINHEGGSLIRSLLEQINSRSLPPAAEPATREVSPVIDVEPVKENPNGVEKSTTEGNPNYKNWVNENL